MDFFPKDKFESFFQGDRPMTTKGYGPPLDALDAVCKAYKALG